MSLPKIGFGPAAPTAVDTENVSIAHALKIVGCQSRSKSTTAIKQDFLVWVRHDTLDISLDDSFAQVHRTWNVARRKLTFFSYVQQGQLVTSFQTRLKILNRAFMNASFRIIYDSQEPR